MVSRLIEASRLLSRRRFKSEINFYYTSNIFPAVSVTGSWCALNCRHCRRKMIERLDSVCEPNELVELCRRFHEKGAVGVLFTGGCTLEGKVPLYDFLDAFRKIKDETGMLLIAHTGILGFDEANSLKDAGLDGVCVDVVGSEETTREVYGIEIYPEDYRRTLKALERAGIGNISPHVCVGLHNGILFHEKSALDIISCIKPTNVVVIGLTNLSDTPMENIWIKPEDVAEVLCEARIRFPESYVSLGCAHGKGEVRAEIEKLAVQCGVNNIAVPTKAAYAEAEACSLEIKEFSACCSLLPRQLENVAFH